VTTLLIEQLVDRSVLGHSDSGLALEAARSEPVGLTDGRGEIIEGKVPRASGATLGAVGVALDLRVGDFGGGAGRSSCPVVSLLDPVEHGALFVGEGGPRIDEFSFEAVSGNPDGLCVRLPGASRRPTPVRGAR
jgi:hypothetical protein